MVYFIKHIKNLKRYLVILGFSCVLMAITSVLTARSMAELTAWFTNHGLHGSKNIIVITVLFFVMDGLICYAYRLLCGRIEANVYSNIQQKSFYQLAHISMDSSLLSNRGDLYNRINKDSAELTEFFATTFPTILMQGVQLVLSIVYIFIVDWRTTAIYLLALVLSLGVQGVLSNYLKRASEQVKKAEVDLNTRLKDSLENRMTVKTYDAYDFIEGLCKEAGEEYVHANMSLNLRSMPIKIAGILCGIAPILVLCLAGLFLVSSGLVTIASFMAVYYLCNNILPYQLHYVDFFMNGVKIKVAANRMKELWEEPVLKGNEEKMFSTQDEIVLENVSYQYPNAKEWAIKDLSMKIEAGKKVAFIGKSGCGKSTAIKLISGFITPQEGKVLVANNRLTGQFPSFFSGTIEDNITCFTKGEKERVEKACKSAGVDLFLGQLKDGLQTVLENNASNLSGGQRQRIALARAFYTEAPVLLFDESISALDAENAKRVVQNAMEEYPKSTVIMVLHQLEFLPWFDEIYLFDQGKVVAHGSYEQLTKDRWIGGKLA